MRKRDDVRKPKQPFFARYLEGQELQQANGARMRTLKYPSDSDEGDPTTKYPSDTDELDA